MYVSHCIDSNMHCPRIFIALLYITIVNAKFTFFDLCQDDTNPSLHLICTTFNDTKVEKIDEFLKYALSQIDSREHGAESLKSHLFSFAELLLTNFKLTSLRIIISSKGIDYQSTKAMMKTFNGKVAFLLDDQLKSSSVKSTKDDGFLVLDSVNGPLLLDFVRDHNVAFWFFESNQFNLLSRLESDHLSIDSNKFIWTPFNKYSEIKILKLYQVHSLDQIHQLLWCFWNLKYIFMVPDVENKISLKNVTISVTAMTVSSKH